MADKLRVLYHSHMSKRFCSRYHSRRPNVCKRQRHSQTRRSKLLRGRGVNGLWTVLGSGAVVDNLYNTAADTTDRSRGSRANCSDCLLMKTECGLTLRSPWKRQIWLLQHHFNSSAGCWAYKSQCNARTQADVPSAPSEVPLSFELCSVFVAVRAPPVTSRGRTLTSAGSSCACPDLWKGCFLFTQW